MPRMNDDLIAFLNARLDEDEAEAEACADNDGCLGWRDSPVQASLGDHTIRTTGSRPVARIREADSRGDDDVPRILSPDAVAAHIARHDPARALREVAAKRVLIGVIDHCKEDLGGYADLMLREMISVYYGDQSDYRQEWGA